MVLRYTWQQAVASDTSTTPWDDPSPTQWSPVQVAAQISHDTAETNKIQRTPRTPYLSLPPWDHVSLTVRCHKKKRGRKQKSEKLSTLYNKESTKRNYFVYRIKWNSSDGTDTACITQVQPPGAGVVEGGCSLVRTDWCIIEERLHSLLLSLHS